MIGIVLAGGASRRFGGMPKGLISLAGRAMALRSAELLAKFCTRVAVECAPGAGYETLGLPLCHALPEHAGKGPLAGTAAGLALGTPGERVAFAPCDMPFLSVEIYCALGAIAAPGVYASTPLGAEPLVAVLGAEMRGALLSALGQADLPRTHAVLDAAGAHMIAFADAAAFANINTPEDLAAAELRLQSQAN